MNERALHFVALVGSVHELSAASAIANTLDELAPDDVQVSVLPSLRILPRFDVYLPGRRLPPGLATLAAGIALADGVVIVAPEYNRSFPGALKDALDWLEWHPGRPLTGKPVAIQTASDCASGEIRAQPYLRQILLAIGAIVLDRPEVAIPEAAHKVDMATQGLRDAQARLDVGLQLAAFTDFSRRPYGPIRSGLLPGQRQPR